MPNQLVLEEYVPYRINVAARNISMQFSVSYREKFNISIHEWRVIAVVGQQSKLSAEEVSERTAMEKVAVSRAVAKLLEKSLLTRTFSTEDRRRSQLTLSEKGTEIYHNVVPIALAYEKELLKDFSDEEIKILMRLLDRLSIKK